MISFYTQRSVLYSVIIRDVSSGSRWEQMQKPMAGYYMKKDLKEWDFIKSHLPQCSRISVEEKAERVRVRGAGGYQEKNAL